jgi:hypothetical protein
MQHRGRPGPAAGPGPAGLQPDGLGAGLAAGSADGFGAGLADGLGPGLAPGAPDELGPGLADGLGVESDDGAGVGLADGEGVGLADVPGVGLDVGVAVELGRGLAEGLGQARGAVPARGVGLADGLTVTDGLGVPLADGPGLAGRLGLGDGRARAAELGQAPGLEQPAGLAVARVGQRAEAAPRGLCRPCAAPVAPAAPPGSVPWPLTAGPLAAPGDPPLSKDQISEAAWETACPGSGTSTNVTTTAASTAAAATTAGCRARRSHPDGGPGHPVRSRLRAAPKAGRSRAGADCSHATAGSSPPSTRPVTAGYPAMIQATGAECGTVSRARIRSRPSSAGSTESASARRARRSHSACSKSG